MAMRETVGSLRAYFLVVAVIGALRSLGEWSLARDSGGLSSTTQGALWLAAAIHTATSLGYGISGLTLRRALPTGARGIDRFLLGTVVALLAQVMIAAAVWGDQAGVSVVTTSGVGLAITIYLRRNLRRLATEAMAAAMPARVV